MNRKRPHSKTRSGCLRCKAKKIKCDEGKPQCSACERYSVPCNYPALPQPSQPSTSSASASASHSHHHPPPPQTTSPPFLDPFPPSSSYPLSETSLDSLEPPFPPPPLLTELSPTSTTLDLPSLELLHHWTLHASQHFGDRPDADLAHWQTAVPHHALQHPFLMRGLLACSALHLARLQPGPSDAAAEHYLALAAAHYAAALPAFRHLVANYATTLNAHNAAAVVAFGGLTAAYAFAHPAPEIYLLLEHPGVRVGVPEWLCIHQGARATLAVARDWLAHGPVAFPLRQAREPVDVGWNPDDARLAALEPLFHSSSRRRHRYSPPGFSSSSSSSSTAAAAAVDVEREEELAAYRMTLALLRECCAIPHAPDQPIGVQLSLFRWVDRVPDLFFELLHAFRPEALVLLAHLCVLIKEGGLRYWWMEGAAERIVTTVEAHLPAEWSGWIEWPAARVAGRA